MPRHRTKMVGTVSQIAAPESDVGKVPVCASDPNPPKRDPKERPVEKPSVEGIENLNVAPVGMLIQRYQKEIKVNGPHTEIARRLKAAIGKAMDAQECGLKSSEEMELIQRAASSRWPIMPDARRKVVKVTEKALGHDDPNVRMRAVRNMISLDRMNQIEEQQEGPGYVPPIASNQPIESSQPTEPADPAAYERRMRFSGIAKRLGISGPIIDVTTSPPGSDSAATDESPSPGGESNGHAGGFCANGHGGKVHGSQTSGHSQPGTNGHSNGKH